MVSPEQETELLGREHARLSRRIAGFRVVRLLLLSAFVFVLYLGFWRGFRRVDTAELDKTRAEIAQLDALLGKDARRFDRSDDPLGFREGTYKSGLPRPPKGAAPAVASAPLSKDEKDKIEEEVKQKRNHLRELYDEGFSFEAELVLDKVNLDVRDWMKVLPIAILLWVLFQIYLHILFKKRQLLEAVAGRQGEAGSESAPTLDRLLFIKNPGGAARFVEHPRQYVAWWQALTLLGLLAALVPLILIAANADDTSYSLSGIVAVAAMYAAVYGRYVSRKLEAQAAGVIGRSLEPTWAARVWEKGERWARTMVFRRKPRLSLVTGSLLILITLYLATAVGSCGSREPGYEVVLGREDWVSAHFLSPSWIAKVLAPVGRGMYILSLILALATLLLVALSRRPGYLHRARLLTTLCAVAGAISLFVLADFSFLVLLGIAGSTLPWTLGWLVPLGLWYAFGFSHRKEARARWEKIRFSLVRLYAPIVICDIYMLVFGVSTGFFGFPAYFVGVHLLAIGYLQLAPGHAAPAPT